MTNISNVLKYEQTKNLLNSLSTSGACSKNFLKKVFYNEKYCILLLFIDAHYLSNFLTILVSSVAKKTGRCREDILADAL